MILCLCHGVSESTVDAVIADGACCLDDIADACSAGSDCGACRRHMLAMLAARTSLADEPALAHAAAR